MKIRGTEENVRLASVVNARLGADARMINARAALWRLGGIGLMSLGIGTGVAFAVLAFARLNDKTFAANQIADILADALRNAKLTAVVDPNSTVRLDPSAEVKLAAGGEVTAKGAVSLDVGGQSGQTALTRPTTTQLNAGAVPQSKRSVTTNYTVFKTVEFSKGAVTTGYNFAPDGDLPKSQHCYYVEEIDGEEAAIKINLGFNGQFRPSKPRAGFDAQAAARNCVWFNGSPTIF